MDGVSGRARRRVALKVRDGVIENIIRAMMRVRESDMKGEARNAKEK